MIHAGLIKQVGVRPESRDSFPGGLAQWLGEGGAGLNAGSEVYGYKVLETLQTKCYLQRYFSQDLGPNKTIGID